MNDTIPTVILGGTGYVAGELLRIIVQHPQLYLSAAISESRAGEQIRAVFPNLQNNFGDQTFVPREHLAEHISDKVAIFCAAQADFLQHRPYSNRHSFHHLTQH